MHLSNLLGKNSRIVVCGDIMLDRYTWGTVERVSPALCANIHETTASSLITVEGEETMNVKTGRFRGETEPGSE